MLVGSARVSTAEQSLALQQDALTAAGCGRTFTDVVSGAVEERDGLAAALDYVRAGDTLVVWRLGRLGRTLRHLIAPVNALDVQGVGWRECYSPTHHGQSTRSAEPCTSRGPPSTATCPRTPGPPARCCPSAPHTCGPNRSVRRSRLDCQRSDTRCGWSPGVSQPEWAEFGLPY